MGFLVEPENASLWIPGGVLLQVGWKAILRPSETGDLRIGGVLLPDDPAETDLRDVRVEDVNLSRSYWQGVQTRGMAFVDSWLTNAFLVGVNFDGVNLNGPCRLQGADLG